MTPDSSTYLLRNWKDAFCDMLTKVCKNDKEAILFGDTNINYLENKDHREKKDDIIASQGFQQLVKDPTRAREDSI